MAFFILSLILNIFLQSTSGNNTNSDIKTIKSFYINFNKTERNSLNDIKKNQISNNIAKDKNKNSSDIYKINLNLSDSKRSLITKKKFINRGSNIL